MNFVFKKIDCRSLIAMCTGAEDLGRQPVYGWVSGVTVNTSGKQSAVLSPVPKKHVEMGVRRILEARGGYVAPATLQKIKVRMQKEWRIAPEK